MALDRRLKVLQSVVRAEALLGEDYSRHPAEQDRVTGSTECDRALAHWASVASGVIPSKHWLYPGDGERWTPSKIQILKMWGCGEQKF